MSADVWAEIDLDAYRRNLRLVQRRVAPAEVMTVVKNDAYGHGIAAVVATAVGEGVRFVGVLDAAVGVGLRASGLPRSVRLFAWLFAPDEDYRAAAAAGVELGVSSVDQLRRIVSTTSTGASGAVPRVHAKIDTGLGRAGARPEDWPALIAAIDAEADAGRVEFSGMWTHIAEASDAEDSASIAAFESATLEVPPRRRDGLVRHLAASAASFERADSRFDLVRVGAFGYGIAPGGGVSPSSLGLTPVMSLRARVIDRVGDSAVIPVGAADGLPDAVHGLEGAAAGRRVALSIGLTETLVADPTLDPGDVVTLFGREDRGEPTLQEWADALGTIGEEIVVRLSRRIERRVSGES
ncbi:alanine racemase [Labedella phragmitis]|uniref:Alanine racemase n=1 Tax=Labedella phragmitis TaxID=2498849 RepID=A0A444PUX5_9MICO|nr:alanine racemase [Labedella phragmitis]RWZ51663.1 alanine racemase [Labedella phragmitis]